MKLLGPQQIKDQKNQEISRDIIRVQETEKVIKDTNFRLAQSQAEFQETLARNRSLWAKEEEEHAKRVKEIKSEIDELEAKKLNELIPFGILKDGIDNRMENAVSFVAKLREREENAERLNDILEEKLDEVGEREQSVKKKEQAIELKSAGIERQKELILANSEKLTQEMSDFSVKKELAEKEIRDQKVALSLKEKELEAKEQIQKRTDKSLLEKEARLADERGVLDRAWKEFKRMGGISP